MSTTQAESVVAHTETATPERPTPRAATVVSLAVIVAACVYLFWLASSLWFLPDDWAFLLHRRVTFLGDHSLLVPHNGHWSLVPILVFRFLFGVAGLHTYLPYVAVTIGLHLGICVTLLMMLRRVGANPWVCCLAIVPAAFIGLGSEDVLWDFQMGFLAPNLLALVSLLLVDRGVTLPRRPVLLWTLGVLALMCSGAGVIAVAWVAAYTLLRRGWRSAIVVTSVPAVVYVAWYLGFGRGTGIAPPVPPAWVLPYVLRGTTNTWDSMLHVPWSGSVVLAVLVVSTAMRSSHARLRMFAAASLLAWVANWVLLAVSRGGWGYVSALQTRYLYASVLLTLPAVALTLQLVWDGLRRHSRVRAVTWAVMGIVLIALGTSGIHQMAGTKRDQVRGLKDQVVAAAEMVQRGDRVLSQKVSPQSYPDIDAETLGRTDVQQRLPDIRPSAQGVIDAAHSIKVGVGAGTFGLPSAPEVHEVAHLTAARGEAGCWDIRADMGAQLLVPRSRGSQIALTVSQGEILTRLVDGDLRSGSTAHEVEAGKRLFVGSTADEGDLLITLPSGEATLCDAGSLTAGG